MRLIDADKLLRRIIPDGTYDSNVIREAITLEPAIDLVTCGECCKRLSCIRACCVDSHSYCSDGIRSKRKARRRVMSEIIDCEMHIGDEVFVHGYIDEIRNDTIIIRNVGGYFGTSRDEVFYYEEDERGYGMMNDADRKTEPQTMVYPQVDGITPSVIVKDKPQISPSDCATCKHNPWSTPRTCSKCVRQDGKPSMYEPQMERSRDER